jgi:hypothetical protein
MSTEKKVYDIYAPLLNYKKAISEFNRPAITINWIPIDHQRRLKAYEVLSALYFNYSRDYRNSPESGDEGSNDSIWEMGDPAWLCDTLKSKLLGNEYGIAIEMPDELRDFDPAAEGADAALVSLKEKLDARQTYLRRWWKNQRVALMVDENESKCSYLGDCAWMAEWDPVDKIPKLRTYDPGFVFPFPGCNEESIEEGGGMVSDRLVVAWEEDSESWKDEEDYIILWQDIYELRVKGDKKSCWRHSGYYRFNSADKLELDNIFDTKSAIEGTESGWVDLGIDFIPVMMVPNIQVQGSEFGLSNLHFHVDNLDAVVNNETDLQKNSSYLGGAMIALSGKDVSQSIDPTTKRPRPIKVAPNTAVTLGEGGSMALLNTSTMQTALIETLNYEIDKLIRNSGVTEIGAGRIEAGQLSTLSIMILMQPLLDKIYPRRVQRNVHYAKLFWMVQRLYQIFGSPEERKLFEGDVYDVVIKFGDIVPRSRVDAMDYYIKLAQLAGDEAALEIARKEGLDIDVKKIIEQKKESAAARAKEETDIFNMRLGLNNQ